MKKSIIGGVIVVLGAIFYALFQGFSSPTVGGLSPTGSVQTNAQLAQVSIFASTTTGTSTSLFNNSYDRAITDAYAFCTGMTKPDTTIAGSATLGLTAATTTVVTSTSTNSSLAVNIGLATTTSTVYAASSSYGSDYLRVWPSSTFLQFFLQATTTATCTVGVHYVAL